MGDLTSLKTGSISYQSLETKYRDFRGPIFTVLINGADITTNKMYATSLTLNTSVEQADSFTMELGGAYDYTAKSFKWKDTIKLGNEVEIRLGYVDKMETSFHGYITSIKYEANSGTDIKIVVSGMDKTFKLMKGLKSRSFIKKTHSDIVSTLAGEAGLTAKVDSTSTVYESVEQYGVSNYNFIKALAEKNNYEAFVSGNDLHFRKLHKSPSAGVTINWTNTMLSFTREDDLFDVPGQISVTGWDSAKKEAVVGVCSSMSPIGSGTSGKSILDKLSSGVTEYYYSEVKSASDAKTMAEAIFYRRAAKLVSGRITSIGIPELRAGTYVQIKDLDPNLDHLYYILSASHEITENGYVTHLSIGSNVV